MLNLLDMDVIKLAKYIEEKCKGTPVYLELSPAGKMVMFKLTTVLGDKVTVELYDKDHYMNAKITTTDDL